MSPKKKDKKTSAESPFLPWPAVWTLFAGWTIFVLGADPQTRRLLAAVAETPGIFLRLMPAPFPLGPAAAFRQHLWRLACLALLALAAWGAGRLSLRASRLELRWDNPFEESAFALGAGLGLLSYAALALGLLGLLYRGAACALIVGFAAAGLREIWKNPPARRNPSPPAGLIPWPLRWAFAGVAAAVLAIQLPYLLTPDIFYDSLVYHLSLPNLYLLNHGMIPTPANPYSGIPFVPQMFFTFAMALDGPVLARLAHFGAGLAACLALFGLAHRWRRPEAGWLAAVYFLACPLVMCESRNTSTGLEWALFQTLAFYSIVAAVEEPEQSPDRKKAFILCGLFAGLAMGTKYPAWTIPLPLFAAILYARVPRPSATRPVWREAATALAAALLVLSPWIAKNAAFYKNPIFPYLEEKVDPALAKKLDWSASTADAGRDLRQTFTTWRGVKNYCLHPWTFSTGVPSQESYYMGPLFLVLLPLLFLLRRRHFPSALLAVLCLGAWLPLSLMTFVPRYFVACLAPLSLLLAYALLQAPGKGLRLYALCLSALLAGLHASALGLESLGDRLWDVVSGRQTEDDYLSHTHPNYTLPPYLGFQYLNRNAPKGAKVLLVGETRSLYLERNFEASSLLNDEILFDLMESSRGPEELKERMDRMGFTHIVVNVGRFFSAGRTGFSFSESAMKNYDGYWGKYTLKEFESYGSADHLVLVYRILGGREALAPHAKDDFLRRFFSIKITPAGRRGLP